MKAKHPFSHLYTFFRQKEAVAIGLVFLLQSAVFAAWLVHIPEVKNRLGLSEGELGALLFGLPIGLLVMNPFTGFITGKWGAVRTTVFALLFMLGSVWLPVFAPLPWMLFAALFVLGLAAALINVAMNTCATLVEEQHSVKIISTCHGLWSVGNLLCSSLLAFAIAAHLPIAFRLGFLSFLVVFSLIFLQKHLKTIHEPVQTAETKSTFIKPTPQLLLLVFIGISVTMGEGLAFDWSGVFMREVAGAPASLAAFGLSAFAGLMAAVRLMGDYLLTLMDWKKLLLLGGITAPLGILLCALFPEPHLCFIGLMLLGGGVALGSPILYAASMRLPNVSPSAGLATFASLSFLGFLTAPPLIGFLGEAFSLRVAFGVMALVVLVGGLTTRALR